MHLSRYLFGGTKVGFIMKIIEDGFNGIVGTTWAEDAQTMNVRSRDGSGCAGTSPRSKKTASRQIGIVGASRGKPFFTGHMTRESIELGNFY